MVLLVVSALFCHWLSANEKFLGVNTNALFHVANKAGTRAEDIVKFTLLGLFGRLDHSV